MARVSFLQERIFQETKIESKDQLLLSKKGTKLSGNDELTLFENEPSLLQTNQQLSEMKQSVYVDLYLGKLSRRYSCSTKVGSSLGW